jgi:hypothetical protein
MTTPISPISGGAASLRTAPGPWSQPHAQTGTPGQGTQAGTDQNAGRAAAPDVKAPVLLPTKPTTDHPIEHPLPGAKLLPSPAVDSDSSTTQAAKAAQASTSELSMAASTTAEFQRGLDTMRAAIDITSRASRLLGSSA